MKTIYDLDLNTGMWSDDSEGPVWIFRVASGWIYCMAKSDVFVPFDNKFQCAAKGTMELAATGSQQLKADIAFRKDIARRIHEGISYGVSDESLAEDIIAVIAQRSAV